MKVILLQDVAKLGRRFEVVTVPDGYGMNKLIPKAMAKLATSENLKQVQAQSAKTASDRETSMADFTTAIMKLKDVVVDVPADANEDGKLYQALKVEQIVAAVLAEHSVVLSPQDIVIKTPIKNLGEHAVELVHGTESAMLTVNLIAV